MMKAKYEYCMTVQEARAERCTELEESEAIYTETLNGNTAALSLQCATLHKEHTEHMQELEACALDDGEQKPPRFPNNTPGGLTPGPTNTQG